MNCEEFERKLLNDLASFHAEHEADFRMDYADWLENLCLYLVPDLDSFRYRGEL